MDVGYNGSAAGCEACCISALPPDVRRGTAAPEQFLSNRWGCALRVAFGQRIKGKARTRGKALKNLDNFTGGAKPPPHIRRQSRACCKSSRQAQTKKTWLPRSPLFLIDGLNYDRARARRADCANSRARGIASIARAICLSSLLKTWTATIVP